MAVAYSISIFIIPFKVIELFIIPNVEALTIPYSFTVLARFSLFIIPLPPPIEITKGKVLHYAQVHC